VLLREKGTHVVQGSRSVQFRLVKDVRLGLFSPESVKRGGTCCALVMTPHVGSRNGRQYESAPHHGAADKSQRDARMGLVTGGAGCCHRKGEVRKTMDSKEQRVLAVLAQARFEDPESDGWMFAIDVWKRVERNRLGWRISLPAVPLTLSRLEDDGFVESRWQDESAPYPRRRVYRITEHGHRERAKHPVRARGSLLGKLRPQPEGR
jgi:hypothetical protein